ncbi:LRC29 protein, partial [Atractosteus spatula]|nr:LRC29 protein [Atractosteus spatula]
MPDRKEASLVCRRWYIACQDYRFQKNLTYKFPASSACLDVIRSLAGRPCCGVAISHLDSSGLSKTILRQVALYLGPRLESISLPWGSITESSFMALVPQLTALRVLDLSGLDSLFMSGTFLSKEESRREVRAALGKLGELDLSNLRYLSDLTFSRLTACAPQLSRLSLAGCHIAFEFDPYRGAPTGCDSSALLSLRNLLRFIGERAHTLRSLNLGRTGITPEALKSLVRVEGLSLEELSLPGCKDLTDSAIAAVCQYQPGLKTLDLSSCTELSDKAVLAIASSLKDIRSLYLRRAWRITDQGLSKLMELKGLQTLDLSECSNITGSEMIKGLSSPQAQAKLVSLSLRSCTYMRDSAVFSLAQLLGPGLRELDLTSCLYLTDLSVRGIATFLPGLLVLRLGWCKEVTDWGLLGMVEPTEECQPEREEADKGPKFSRTFGNMGFFSPPQPPAFEEKPRLVTAEELGRLGEREGASLRALRGLQELDLSACSKLTDSSITQVVQFPDLRKLSLSLLSEITDRSLLSVSQHCRGLTSLSLSHCPGLSDQGLAGAAPHLQRLQHLQLACCDGLSNRSLTVLAQHCRRLRTLDVSMCKKITMAGVDHLQAQLPFLENVHSRFVGGADLCFTL